MLAGKIKEKNRSVYVPQIKGKKGQLIRTTKDIAQTFGEYYASLYNLTQTPTPLQAIEDYLSSVGLTRLPSPARCSLETPILMEELNTVLKTVKSGKALGPDGFSIRYYKEFSSILSAQMIKVFNAVGQTVALPPDALLAHITLISKEGKDPVR